MLAFFALVTTGFLILWATAIPLAFGWQPLSILSGSMEPQIGVGDVVIAKPFESQTLQPGMVVVYEDPVFGGLVSHRIQSVNDDGTLTTKGDANESADSTPTPVENVVGVGRILVPVVGWPAVWADIGDYVSLAMSAAVWSLLLYLARWGVLARFDPWLYEAPGRPTTALPTATLTRRQRGRHLRRRRSRLRPIVGVGTALGVLTAVMAIGASSAVFAATTSNPGNSIRAASTFGCTAPGTQAVVADADTYVMQPDPLKNFDEQGKLELSAKTNEVQHIYVHFALPTIPTGCSVVSATLRLRDDGANLGRTISVHRAASAWSETVLNWSNRPGYLASPVATSASGGQWTTWNIASHVTAMYASGNHGFVIKDQSENYDVKQAYRERETAIPGEEPTLSITFG